MASTGSWSLATETIIDARGLRCPLPALKLEKRLDTSPAGSRIVVLATDPMAKVDIPFYCRKHGHGCTVTSEGDTLRFDVIAAG